MDEIKDLLKVILGRMEEMGAELKALRDDVDHIKKDMAVMKATQIRQDKILETLALRSVEAEAEIRELKEKRESA